MPGSSARSRKRRSVRSSAARRPSGEHVFGHVPARARPSASSASSRARSSAAPRSGDLRQLRARRRARGCRRPPTPGTSNRIACSAAKNPRARSRSRSTSPAAVRRRTSRSGSCADADGAVDVARELLDAVVADGEAEILRRHVLELVRFVDDRVAAGGNHLAVRALPHRRVGAEQVVVDDDDVGLGGALAHARDEAVVVARALGAEAVFGGRRDVVPERQVLRQILELGAVAGLGLAAPLVDDADEQRLVLGAAEALSTWRKPEFAVPSGTRRIDAGTGSCRALSCRSR